MVEPKILVIDDEPHLARLCQRWLERKGYQVLVATSPSQGLSYLSRQEIALLLVDIRMPGLDGFQILSLARRYQPDLAAIIMTGYGTMDIALASLNHNADRLLLKPFTEDQLVENVQQTLEDNERKREAVRLHALRPLFDFTESLFTVSPYEELPVQIAMGICEHMQCQVSGFYQGEHGTGKLHLTACQGEWQLREELRLDDRLLGRAVAEGNLLRGSQGFVDPQLQGFLEQHQLEAMIAVPVRQKDTLNLFLAGRKHGEQVFRLADLELFQILVRQAAAALENGRLQGELRANIAKVELSQKALIRAEKMAAAGRLTATIAHEINNPMQSLRNCLHLAGRQELALADRQKYLSMAQNELERLMATMQRMLEFFRPGAVDRQLCDLNSLIRKVVALIEPQLSRVGVKTELNLAPDLPQITVVSSQVQQVLINLILNSMEAMPGGGKISLWTARAGLEPQKNGSPVSVVSGRRTGVEVCIADTGPGLSAAARERIFEPFASTKENGTGLGLAVSYGIITAHGGTLALVDQAEGGACFRITLPEDE